MVMRQIEQKLGLPPLIQVSDVLKNLPDEKKLRLVKQILDSAVKVKGGPEELETLLQVIRLISSASLEQLTAIRDITANLVKLVRLLPKGMSLDKLPLGEIVNELKKD